MLREAQHERVHRVLRTLVSSCPGVVVAVVANKEAVTLACEPDDPRADALSRAGTAVLALAEGAALELEGGPVSQVVVRAAKGHLVVQQVSAANALAVYCAAKAALGGVLVEVAAAAKALSGVV